MSLGGLFAHEKKETFQALASDSDFEVLFLDFSQTLQEIKDSAMNWEKHFRSMKPRHKTVEFGGIMHADDLNAVNQYMHTTPAKTQEARKLLSDWAAWWVTTGDPSNYTFLVPDTVWDEARNRRLAFNVANAVTAEEKQQVVEVATQGMSTEEARGEQDRRDPNTGFIFVPPKPPLPTWFWPVVVGSVVLGVGVPIVKKVLLPI